MVGEEGGAPDLPDLNQGFLGVYGVFMCRVGCQSQHCVDAGRVREIVEAVGKRKSEGQHLRVFLALCRPLYKDEHLKAAFIQNKVSYTDLHPECRQFWREGGRPCEFADTAIFTSSFVRVVSLDYDRYGGRVSLKAVRQKVEPQKMEPVDQGAGKEAGGDKKKGVEQASRKEEKAPPPVSAAKTTKPNSVQGAEFEPRNGPKTAPAPSPKEKPPKQATAKVGKESKEIKIKEPAPAEDTSGNSDDEEPDEGDGDEFETERERKLFRALRRAKKRAKGLENGIKTLTAGQTIPSAPQPKPDLIKTEAKDEKPQPIKRFSRTEQKKLELKEEEPGKDRKKNGKVIKGSTPSDAEIVTID